MTSVQVFIFLEISKLGENKKSCCAVLVDQVGTAFLGQVIDEALNDVELDPANQRGLAPLLAQYTGSL